MSRSNDSGGDVISLHEFLELVSRRRLGIVLIVLSSLAAAVLWTGTRTPLFRASALLMLEQDGAQTAVLADLAALTSAPAAESEMAILRSRSLAESCARDPATWDPPPTLFEPAEADAWHDQEPGRLGLSTRAQAADLAPLNGLLGGTGPGAHRLHSRVEAALPGSPGAVVVHFPSRDRVRLSLPGMFGGSEAVELPYRRGEPLSYRGLRLRLVAVGDFVGCSYRVLHQPHEDAVEWLLGRIRVSETARNSGVIRLSVEDSDPHRAAEIANALARNYILRSIRIGSLRATRTGLFIEAQLATQLSLLEAVEREVVALSAEHANALHVSATAEALIEKLAEVETRKTQIALARVALEEAVELLQQGEYEALSRLGKDLPDLISLRYIEAIGQLTADTLALERSDVGAYKHLLQQQVAQLRGRVEEASLQKRRIETVVDALERGDFAALARLEIGGGDRDGLDATTTEYVREIARLDTELSVLGKQLTEKHPQIAAARAALAELVEKTRLRLSNAVQGLALVIADYEALVVSHGESIAEWPAQERARIEAAVAELRRRVLGNLASQLEGLVAQDGVLAAEIDAARAELGALPESERVLADSLRRREAYGGIVKMLLESQQQAELSEASTMPKAVLIDPAMPPRRRASPLVLVNLIVAIVLGLAAGIGIAFLRESLAGSPHSEAEIEEATGLPVLGSIPDFRRGRLRVKDAGKEYLPVRARGDGVVAEAYRSVRDTLRFATEAGATLRTLAVTSCTPGEGKSTANIALSMVFASSERRVLLVDADMRRPSVGDSFALDDGPGLAEVLEGETSWGECLRRGEYPNLDILPAGHYQRAPSDLLRGACAAGLLDELLAAYDLVVFDLPPAMAVADVGTFADRLDALLLLYRPGRVPGSVLAAATKRLRRSGARLAGVLVNAVRPRGRLGSSYYGSGYGYGYGYGREEGGRKAG